MLAIDGGDKVRDEPFPKRQLFGQEEKQAALELFDQAIQTGDSIGYNGQQERGYETDFVKFMGGGYADLVNSGTSALYVALGALKLPVGGEVVVPPITDPGGVMPVALLCQVPVVADAEEGTFNTSAEKIEEVITPHTRAIVVAHIAGEPVDMDPILELAKGYGIPIVEDCAQAHGARYKGRLVGTLGAVAAFSTMSGKHHATGPQGGVVFSLDAGILAEAKRFADRGKPFGLEANSNVRAGLNLNGNELSAAIGRVQICRLPEMIQRRRKIAQEIKEAIAGLRGVCPGREAGGEGGVYWFMRFKVNKEVMNVSKDDFSEALKAEGIPVTNSYRHLPSESDWFRKRCVFPGSDYPWGLPSYKGAREREFLCENAVNAAEQHFILSIHEQFGPREVMDIAEAFKKVETAYIV